MSGSRRNRTNLNVQVDPARLPVYQLSQPQAASATIQSLYQQQRPVNVLNLASESRPMTVQYVQQNAPLVQHQAAQMVQDNRSLHAQATPTPLQNSYVAAQPRSNPPATDFVVDRFTAAVNSILTKHQQSTSAMIEKMETAIETLSSHVKQANDVAQSQTKLLVEAMQKAFVMQQGKSKALSDRMEKLEKVMGTNNDSDGDKSVLNRLEVISFTVEEILERVNDTEALVPDHPVPNATILPHEKYVDACVNAQIPEQPTPPREVIPPMFVQHATSPVRQVYVDASVSSRTPAPPTPLRQRGSTTLNEIATSPVRPAHVDDAAITLQGLEPKRPLLPAIATTPIRRVYSSFGTDSRTPEPPKPPRRFQSTGVSSTIDLPPLSTTSSRRYSSDAVTLVGDASYLEIKSAVDLDDLSISPRLKRKRVTVAHSLEDQDLEMEHLPSAQDGTVPESDAPNGTSPVDVAMIQSLFSSSPILSGSLSAADWDDEAHNDNHSGDEDANGSARPVFRPTSSPSTAKQYSLLAQRQESPEGTVASLRQDALGDAHAHVNTAPPSPPQPIIPFHPRPSISPLPSPESSPSPSPPPPSARTRLKENVVKSPSWDKAKSPESPKIRLPARPRANARPGSPNTSKLDVEAVAKKGEVNENVVINKAKSPESPRIRVPARPTANARPGSSKTDSPNLGSAAKKGKMEFVASKVSPMRREPIIVSSPPPEDPLPSPVHEVPVASPMYEEPTPAPAPQEADPSAPMPVDDVVLDSEEESELSVRRMITETFENLGEIESNSTLTSLFLPDPESRSYSPAVDLTSPSTTPTRLSLSNRRVVVSPSRSLSPIADAESTKAAPTPVTPTQKSAGIKKPSPLQWKTGARAGAGHGPRIAPPALAARPKPLRMTATAAKPVAVSEPIYISSRSPSPLSDLSESESASKENCDSDNDSDVRIIPVKKKNSNSKAKSETVASTSTSTSAAAAEHPRLPLPPLVDLKKKLLKKSGQSAAVTRVKKRKAQSMEEMEPPLKRARVKASEEGAKRERKGVGAASGKGKEKETAGRVKSKEKSVKPASKSSAKDVGSRLRPRAAPTGCTWPEKNKTGDKKFNQQFIECDVCFLWYHYGCVGISDMEDIRIKGEELFTCPPCSGGGANPMVSSKNIVCARPDCGQEQKQPDEFFMTGIMGRSTRVHGGTGRRYIWLVRWDGYSIKDCTWESEDGMSDPSTFIQHFNATALKEGIDPEEDPHSTILLREAIAVGWKDPNA